MQYDTIGEQFREQFQAVFANTAELKQEVYRIRYEVYCQELGYESPDKFPDRLESDSYDERSLHCMLKHRISGQYAGCVRLVFPDPYQSDRSLPISKICSLDLDLKELPTHSFGEVSRLAVIDRFRRRTGESQTPAGLLLFPNQTQEEREKRGFPIIALSLYLAATCIGMESGMDRVLVLMEPRLARHLRYFGFLFTQIGDFIEFRGKRGPYQITKESIGAGLPAHIVELMEIIRSDLKLSDLNIKLDLTPKAVVI
ncbi:MAG: PEP-CTERM/exosortase system-associated acyltransferase [Hydrococcus sp. Prado102]|jgi:N-acyl amino acid synthase of PEP-CTERM/exosortase system|nr:PEP-CTERM/exosortase system-associated acyltransferase [Hydrococcus sp. Prado102]